MAIDAVSDFWADDITDVSGFACDTNLIPA
jgi:hypothetical protein